MRSSFLLPFLMMFLFSGCGKKGPLIYPDMLVPNSVTALMAMQSGTNVKLSFRLPEKDLTGRALKDLAGVKIYKREEFLSQQPECPYCKEDFILFRKLYLDFPAPAQVYGKQVVLMDTEAILNSAFSYYVTAFTQDGADGQASGPVRISVTPPPVPPVLQIQPSPTNITLKLTKPSVIKDNTFLGYNLYRAPKGGVMPLLAMNRAPFSENSYVDTTPERDTVYRYAATTVVRTRSGSIEESGLSNEAEGILKNDEE